MRRLTKSECILATVLVFQLLIIATVWLCWSPQIYGIKGCSMEPTLHDEGLVVTVGRGYNVDRNDIVVLRLRELPDRVLIKRVVAVPGDYILFNQNARQFTIVKTEAIEKYTLRGAVAQAVNEVKEEFSSIILLQANEFFVAGDNREHSLDSRNFGPVKREEIIGEMIHILW